jgi:hypothetical protein
MNTIFKRGNVYVAPRLGDHLIMPVSAVRSNNEDCLYCMTTDGSYATIPYQQLGYYKDISKSQYLAIESLIEEMRLRLERVAPESVQQQQHMVTQPTPQEESAIEPSHYGGKDNTYEAIKVIEAWRLDFYLGNVAKYISRAGKKDKSKELEDLLKAQWYLNKKIELWQEEN